MRKQEAGGESKAGEMRRAGRTEREGMHKDHLLKLGPGGTKTAMERETGNRQSQGWWWDMRRLSCSQEACLVCNKTPETNKPVHVAEHRA